MCNVNEVENVILRAKAVQEGWKHTDEKTRSRFLHQLANSIEQSDFEEVAKLMVLEQGKPYPEAIGELANCATIFRYYAEMARDEAGVLPGTTQLGSFQFAKFFPTVFRPTSSRSTFQSSSCAGQSRHHLPLEIPVL